VDAYSSRYNDFYYGIGIEKKMGKVHAGLQYAYAEINGSKLYQWVPEITCYPFGNNRLFFSAAVLFRPAEPEQPVYQGLLGIRIFPDTWLETFIAAGKSQYAALFDGTIIYNNPDYLMSRTGASFTHYFTDKTSLILYYAAESKEQFISGDPYIHHAAALGLHFKF
jgi:hypothetical protein